MPLSATQNRRVQGQGLRLLLVRALRGLLLQLLFLLLLPVPLCCRIGICGADIKGMPGVIVCFVAGFVSLRLLRCWLLLLR